MRHVGGWLLGFGLAFGCTLRLDWPEHDIRLALVPDDAPLHTVTSGGVELEITSIELRATTIELVPCGEDLASLIGPSRAWAHSIGENTTTATTVRVEAVSDHEREIARWSPPEGHYCSIAMEFAGPDDEPTLVVRGRQRVGADWVPFEWTDTARASLAVKLPEPLELGSRSRIITVELRAETAVWLEALPDDVSSSDAARAVLTGAASAWEVMS